MYKKLFWISLLLLLLSNAFWMYQLLDNAVGYTYLRESYDDLEQDVHMARQLIETEYENFDQLVAALDSSTYEVIKKGDEFFLVFESFAIQFHPDSTIKRTKDFYEE